ncbi:MAG: YnbE family lipoprotein [Gammaproteobacteria bacterium]
MLIEAVVHRVHAFRHVACRSAALTMAVLIGACTPTVKVEAPREPITINLNIKLDADVRVKLEQQAKDDVATKPIF